MMKGLRFEIGASTESEIRLLDLASFKENLHQARHFRIQGEQEDAACGAIQAMQRKDSSTDLVPKHLQHWRFVVPPASMDK
jgi:hypothetical protein